MLCRAIYYWNGVIDHAVWQGARTYLALAQLLRVVPPVVHPSAPLASFYSRPYGDSLDHRSPYPSPLSLFHKNLVSLVN